MNRSPSRAFLRLSMILVTAAFALSVSACDSLLEVEDPVNLTPEDLAGDAPVDLTINGMRGAFQDMMDNYILHAGMLVDEFVLAGTFPYRQEIDERAVQTNNSGLLNELFNPLQVTRFMADTGVVILQAAQDDPGADQAALAAGIALGKYYGAYARMLLAEAFCISPIAGGPGLTSDERMQDALAVFQEAESAAQAAGDNDLVMAAKVGQARAHLWLGAYSAAASAAQAVPDDFEYLAHYSSNSVNQFNRIADLNWALDDVIRWTVGDGTVSFTHFEKYAYFEEWVDLGLLTPRPDLEAFNPEIPVVQETKYTVANDPIVIASGDEARLIRAEGLLRNNDPTGAAAIVNQLRLDHWGLAPIAFTGTTTENLLTMARERARELFIEGQRLGTLRRLLDDSIDLFPTGKIGSNTCFPLPETETDTNPNF